MNWAFTVVSRMNDLENFLQLHKLALKITEPRQQEVLDPEKERSGFNKIQPSIRFL